MFQKIQPNLQSSVQIILRNKNQGLRIWTQNISTDYLGAIPDRKIALEHRLTAAHFWIFKKPSNSFLKKYLSVAYDTHYNSANFQWKIFCISSAAKKPNMTIFGNTVAHSKLYYSHLELQFSFFAQANTRFST
jgi:hypothetical protein